MPDRPDRMKDGSGRKTVAFRQLHLAYCTASEQTTRFRQFRPGNAMNRAAHATAWKQRLIRSVHDGVNVQRGNIGTNGTTRGPFSGMTQPPCSKFSVDRPHTFITTIFPLSQSGYIALEVPMRFTVCPVPKRSSFQLHCHSNARCLSPACSL